MALQISWSSTWSGRYRQTRPDVSEAKVVVVAGSSSSIHWLDAAAETDAVHAVHAGETAETVQDDTAASSTIDSTRLNPNLFDCTAFLFPFPSDTSSAPDVVVTTSSIAAKCPRHVGATPSSWWALVPPSSASSRTGVVAVAQDPYCGVGGFGGG